MADSTEGWLRRGLADWLGPSWRSTAIGLMLILTGLVLFLVGWATGEGTLKLTGLGLIPTGVLGLVTRDNSASVASHDESLAKIADAEAKQEVAHVKNVVKIEQLTAQVDAVPEIVSQVIKAEAPAVIAQAAQEVVNEQRKPG